MSLEHTMRMYAATLAAFRLVTSPNTPGVVRAVGDAAAELVREEWAYRVYRRRLAEYLAANGEGGPLVVEVTPFDILAEIELHR